MKKLIIDKNWLEERGLSNEDAQKILWINENYEVYPGMMLLTIPAKAYEENFLESGFKNDDGQELDKYQKEAAKLQRSEFEQKYLQAGDKLIVLTVGEVEENNITGIFNFAEVGDVVTLHGHARLQGIDLDMSYVAEDGSLNDSIHVTIVRGSEVLMKQKFSESTIEFNSFKEEKEG